MILPYILAAKRIVVNRYRTVVYRGEKVHCLPCGWKGRHFFERARCPSCGSLARTRLFAWAIDRFSIDLCNKAILHVAPNFSEYQFLKRKAKNCVYDRIDINPKARYTNVVGDVTDLPFLSGRYDLVVMWHVMEHIEDDFRAIREIKRVLKPGGLLLLSVPIYPLYNPITYESRSIPRERYKEVHGHPDHCRSCGLDYYLRFEALGFSTRTLMVRDVAEAERTNFGLSRGHVVWLFQKE